MPIHCQAIVAKRCDEDLRSPMAKTALSSSATSPGLPGRAAAQPRHLGRGSGFVDKDRPFTGASSFTADGDRSTPAARRRHRRDRFRSPEVLFSTVKPCVTNRATVPRRCQRTRLHLALRQPNRRRWCHPKPTRRRPARLATLDLADNPNPKIR